MTKYQILLFLMVFVKPIFGQHYVLDSLTPTLGHLIDFDANRFKMVNHAPTFHKFFAKLDAIYEGRNQKLHIFHLGDSHVQADMYSNKIRTYLQNTNTVSQGQRGFVFPFDLAHTNNPANYKVEANTSLWQGYRSSVVKDSIAWGLSGITAVFRGTTDTIYIKSNYINQTQQPYEFNKLRVFYNTWKSDYHLSVQDHGLDVSDTLNQDQMYREFRFNHLTKKVKLTLKLNDTTLQNPEFALMGLEFMNDQSGIEFTSIGVNVASFAFYGRAAYFEKQLRLYHPDLFIISLGTNDGYMPQNEFDPESYQLHYDALIQIIQGINPDCAILLMVPNDNYYRQELPNPNTASQQKIIMKVAEKHQMAVWDFYDIMGGLGASNSWHQHKLMPRDRVHFTPLGYSVKADLFLLALIDAWAESTGRNKEELLKHYQTLDK